MNAPLLTTVVEGLRPALPVLLDWGLKTVVVFAAAALLTTLLRRRSASLRHFLWGTAVVGVLALPLLGAVGPDWHVPLPEISPPAHEEGARDLPASAGSGEAVGSVAADDAVAPPATLATSPADPVEPARGAGPAGTVRWTALIVPVWLGGTALLLLGVLASLGQAMRLTRRTRPADDQRLLMLGNECVERLGIHRPVRLRLSDDRAMPMTWGVLRPVVLLPASAVSWSTGRIRTVLLHELAHVRRCDFVTQLLARVVCAIHWMNPLAWRAARKLREEREHACDDVVLRHGARASDYADHLLDIARSLQCGRLAAVATVAMARPSQLSDRLLAVLDASRTRGGLTGRSGLFGAMAAALFVLPIAAASPARDTAPGSEGGEGGEEARIGVLSSPFVSLDPAVEAPARPGVPLQSLCDWTRRGEDRNSSSMTVDDEHATIVIVADDCRLEIEYRGEITYAADDTDITAISPGGYFLIEERMGSERREAELRANRDGTLERKWFVNRQERPYGAEAEAWLAGVLPYLFRRTGINAEARATRILRTSGPEGLLQEITLIPSDYAARKYYEILLAQPDLSTDLVRRVVREAGQRIGSDHELGRLLRTIAEQQPMDETVRIAYVEAAGSIGSDHEHARVLRAVLDRQGLSRELADAMLRSARDIDSDHEVGRLLREFLAANRLDDVLRPAFFEAFENIGSDHEKRRILSAALEQGSADRAMLDRILGYAEEVGSDHERGRLLREVAALYPMDGALPASYLQAARGIGSDHELGQILRTLIERDRLSDATVNSILEAATAIGSDHELGRVLILLVDQNAVNDATRPAVMRALDTISSEHTRGQVLSKLYPRGRPAN